MRSESDHAELVAYLREMVTLLDRGHPLSASESLNLRVAVEDAAAALSRVPAAGERERELEERVALHKARADALRDDLRRANDTIRKLTVLRAPVAGTDTPHQEHNVRQAMKARAALRSTPADPVEDARVAMERVSGQPISADDARAFLDSFATPAEPDQEEDR